MDADIDRASHFLVTATIIDSVIYQHKVRLHYHEEPNTQNRIGGAEDYYFSLADTLATSTLVIQKDGQIVGDNLADVK
ncbi:hypothetical protein E1176_01355 [Fulvivirga sp. RKSG066]|nr:hypothetical protein [Fulvivirga aurantia]